MNYFKKYDNHNETLFENDTIKHSDTNKNRSDRILSDKLT